MHNDIYRTVKLDSDSTRSQQAESRKTIFLPTDGGQAYIKINRGEIWACYLSARSIWQPVRDDIYRISYRQWLAVYLSRTSWRAVERDCLTKLRSRLSNHGLVSYRPVHAIEHMPPDVSVCVCVCVCGCVWGGSGKCMIGRV